jgi:hypothetical protein
MQSFRGAQRLSGAGIGLSMIAAGKRAIRSVGHPQTRAPQLRDISESTNQRINESTVSDVHRDFHTETEINGLWLFPAHGLS